MRKSGWAAATGLGSLVLLLAACGGSSSSNTAAGATASTARASAVASSSSGSAAQATSPASASSKAAGAATTSAQGSSPTSYATAGPQPSSGTAFSFPPQGTTFMIVAHTALGYVMAQANGQVVYTYAKDVKGGSPTCTGSCAASWPPVTGTPKAGPADTFPGTFGVVKGSGGVEQVTYNGYPLYKFQGAQSYSVAGNGIGGVWHVIPLSVSDIKG